MPVMDGKELLRRLRSSPVHASIPVIVITAMHSDFFESEAWLPKPFLIEELLTMIRKRLGQILDPVSTGPRAVKLGTSAGGPAF
jgi:DNA-binding response OmpR family regulator